MKASELQINDLVLDQYGKIARVTSMSDSMIVTELDGGMTLSRPEQVQPIPLTEDILVKNGFHRSPRWHYCEITTEDGFKIYVQLGCGGAIDYVRITKRNSDFMERDLDATISIHYVHELQHLFHLCGIEKELTI